MKSMHRLVSALYLYITRKHPAAKTDGVPQTGFRYKSRPPFAEVPRKELHICPVLDSLQNKQGTIQNMYFSKWKTPVNTTFCIEPSSPDPMSRCQLFEPMQHMPTLGCSKWSGHSQSIIPIGQPRSKGDQIKDLADYL